MDSPDGHCGPDLSTWLHRISVWDKQQEREIVLLTYRDLWAWLDDPSGVLTRKLGGE